MYDAHGNIQFLKRNGLKDDNKPGLIDDLEFKYIGNQMRSVKDHADPVMSSASADIKDYADQDMEFIYNDNGAMRKDLNKGIQEIAYNILNLPKELFIDNTSVKAKNTYLYTASGSKLKVVHQSDPKQKEVPVSGITEASGEYAQTHTTDYVGNMIYEDGSLKKILLSNGYYDNDDKKFYFYIRDHLGNNRIVADAAGTVIQSNQYYPFGMEFTESTTAEQSSQPYKYNGKKLDETHGLNWYDYSARHYDAGYIATPTMDASSEKFYSWSPYTYCKNNPINRIDPDGKADIPAIIAKYYWSRFDIKNDVINLPTVTVEGKPVWEQKESGGIIYNYNNYTQQRVVVGEKPLEQVNIEFDILLMGRLAVNAASSVAQASTTTSVVAENTAAKTSTSLVQANRKAGNLFRDELATALRAEGRTVNKEVYKWTPFGKRYMDLDVWQNGVNLGGIEAKVGGSRYLPLQKLKDVWLGANGYPVQLVRKPTNW